MSELKIIVSNNILPVELRDIPSIMKGEQGERGRDGSFTQKAYKTYAAMVVDKLNVPKNTSVLVNNDPDKSKNAIYTYDGTTFTKSDFDPQGILSSVDIRLNQAVESASDFFEGEANSLITEVTAVNNSAFNQAILNTTAIYDYDVRTLEEQTIIFESNLRKAIYITKIQPTNRTEIAIK